MESSLDDSNNRTAVGELHLALSYLVKLTSTEDLRFTVVTDAGIMQATDVATYISILTALLREEAITHPPPAMDVNGIVLNGIVTEANFPNTNLPKVHLDYINERIFEPNQYTSKKTFVREIGRLFDVYLDINKYARSIVDARDRVNCINLVTSLFINETIALPNPNVDLGDWLNAKRLIDPRNFDSTDLILMLENVILQITELTISSNLNGERQKATIETLMSLSSYSISCAYTNVNADGYALEYSSARIMSIKFVNNSDNPLMIDIKHRPFETSLSPHTDRLRIIQPTMSLGQVENDHPSLVHVDSGFNNSFTFPPSTAVYDILTETPLQDFGMGNITTLNTLSQSLLNQIRSI